ncbi:MAG: phosphotransferase, partial [Cellvibrionaceae bacterium]|nr:phosphotransferase [Cellvibrionaceae bacterium]
VHRDYHSRNIMLGPDGLALIDFQDALWGPISYDLVSLLRDCYVYWPERQVANWVEQYRHSLAAQCNITLAPEQWQRWFDWMGLQRHIKVLGIFARLYLRDGKAVYLDDLPLVIRYCLSVAERYPETSAFAQWFKQTLLPLCQQQPWYRDYKRAGEDGAHLERE